MSTSAKGQTFFLSNLDLLFRIYQQILCLKLGQNLLDADDMEIFIPQLCVNPCQKLDQNVWWQRGRLHHFPFLPALVE